jgi:hypothetical protein
MKTILAGIAIVCSVIMLSSCDKLTGAGEIIRDFRAFTFSWKKLPAGVTLQVAKGMMERRDNATRSGAQEYIGNLGDTDPAATHTLRVFPAGSSHSGSIDIQVSDAGTPSESAVPTGAFIEVTPLPAVGDTVESGTAQIFFGSNGASTFSNSNDPNSYFRFVINSLDMTAKKASGSFELLVTAGSGAHAGDIYAITDGAFTMDIAN